MLQEISGENPRLVLHPLPMYSRNHDPYKNKVSSTLFVQTLNHFQLRIFKYKENGNNKEDCLVRRGICEKCTSKPSALYASMYTADGKYIVAGGTGRNEVRIFKNDDPIEGYKVVSSISDLNMACLTIDCAHEGYGFAFGCADGYLRIMNMTDAPPHEP